MTTPEGAPFHHSALAEQGWRRVGTADPLSYLCSETSSSEVPASVGDTAKLARIRSASGPGASESGGGGGRILPESQPLRAVAGAARGRANRQVGGEGKWTAWTPRVRECS
jgi:hypothetical protein